MHVTFLCRVRSVSETLFFVSHPCTYDSGLAKRVLMYWGKWGK